MFGQCDGDHNWPKEETRWNRHRFQRRNVNEHWQIVEHSDQVISMHMVICFADISCSRPLIVRRKKLLTTAQYIYKTFYVEEQNSDISVMALGKVWHLHKIYLCQSPYFASMFSGSWREREQKFVAIEIIDPKITLECKWFHAKALHCEFTWMEYYLQRWMWCLAPCTWTRWRWTRKRLSQW